MTRREHGYAPFFSVVLPTHNRPALLAEAVRSITLQTTTDWELIVVDDGSSPPVDGVALGHLAGERLIIVRHDEPRGVAVARRSGYARARGEFVAQLDDDDRLAPGALACVARILRDDPSPDVLFLDVCAFGSECADVNARQSVSLAQTLARAGAEAGRNTAPVRFGARLFDALLEGVPAAFQHSVFRRALLDGMHPALAYSWPESAWAIEVAARGFQCVLIREPLYLWRRDGQSYFSLPGMEARGLDDHIAMKRHLLDTLGPQVDRPSRIKLRRALGRALFDRCYARMRQGQAVPWRDLAESARLAPGLRQIRLLSRYVIAGRHQAPA